MPLYPLAPHAPQPTPHRQQPSYPSSMTDSEWAVIEPLLGPPARPHGGRPPKHPLRQIVDAIRYLVRAGCAWRLLPGDFPPWQTVYWWFAKWAADHTLDRVHDALRDQVRVAAGRTPAPSAAIIDSQSVRAADTVSRASRGFDAGKKVNGRKRHLAVDTLGLLLVLMVTAASTQDRDAARPLLWRLRAGYRGIRCAGPTAATPASWWAGPPPCCTWWSRSSASTLASRPSRCCRAAGWWSERLRGSASTAARSATTSACPPITRPWSGGR
jgi:transposase